MHKKERITSMKKVNKVVVTAVAFLILWGMLVGISAVKVQAVTLGEFECGLLDDGTVAIYGYTGSSTKVRFPATIEGYVVSQIGDTDVYTKDRMWGLSDVKEIEIAEGIKEIGYFAFDGCTNIEKISIPNSIVAIHSAAFYRCLSLNSVSIPEGVTIEGWRLFEDCTSLESVDIPLSGLGYCTFSGCSSLRSVNLGSTMTELGEWAFDGCTSLSYIKLPATLKKINREAFSGCTSLTTITVPDNVTDIEENAFEDCTSLSSVNIGTGLKSIGTEAFNNTALTEIHLPSGVNAIGEHAFGFGKGLFNEWKVNTNFKVYGTPGTTAEYYATGNGMIFISTTPAAADYTVKFETNGGSSINSITVEDGKKITKPSNPTKEGYTFLGWFKDAALTQAWDFDKDVVTANMTLYAKWKGEGYVVTFETNGGSQIAPETVEPDTLLTKPADPTKTGYKFGGWYSDSTLTTPWDFSNKVTKDMTLYAKWTTDLVTVKFDSNGGSSVPSQEIEPGSTVTKPTDPQKTGAVFSGWYSDSSLTKAWDFSTKVTEDMTLYAKWVEDDTKYTVFFNTLGGSYVDTQIVAQGGVVVRPADPVRSGYIFSGWYSDSTCYNAWNFSTKVTNDMILYAKWIQNNEELFDANIEPGEKITFKVSKKVVKVTVGDKDIVKAKKKGKKVIITGKDYGTTVVIAYGKKNKVLKRWEVNVE